MFKRGIFAGADLLSTQAAFPVLAIKHYFHSAFVLGVAFRGILADFAAVEVSPHGSCADEFVAKHILLAWEIFASDNCLSLWDAGASLLDLLQPFYDSFRKLPLSLSVARSGRGFGDFVSDNPAHCFNDHFSLHFAANCDHVPYLPSRDARCNSFAHAPAFNFFSARSCL
jgi:hypothetical protein